MNRPRRKLVILAIAIILGGVAWYAGLFRTADCLIAGGSWNWSGRYCRLDRLVPAQPFIPG